MPSHKNTAPGDQPKPTIIHLEGLADNRGCLLPVDFSSLPFEPKRMFVVSDVPAGCVRGGHGHHTGHQLLIALQGEVDVVTRDSFGAEVLHPLNTQTLALYLPPKYVAWQKYLSCHACLLVLASNCYDPADYLYSDGPLSDSAWDRS